MFAKYMFSFMLMTVAARAEIDGTAADGHGLQECRLTNLGKFELVKTVRLAVKKQQLLDMTQFYQDMNMTNDLLVETKARFDALTNALAKSEDKPQFYHTKAKPDEAGSTCYATDYGRLVSPNNPIELLLLRNYLKANRLETILVQGIARPTGMYSDQGYLLFPYQGDLTVDKFNLGMAAYHSNNTYVIPTQDQEYDIVCRRRPLVVHYDQQGKDGVLSGLMQFATARTDFSKFFKKFWQTVREAPALTDLSTRNVITVPKTTLLDPVISILKTFAVPGYEFVKGFNGAEVSKVVSLVEALKGFSNAVKLVREKLQVKGNSALGQGYTNLLGGQPAILELEGRDPTSGTIKVDTSLPIETGHTILIYTFNSVFYKGYATSVRYFMVIVGPRGDVVEHLINEDEFQFLDCVRTDRHEVCESFIRPPSYPICSKALYESLAAATSLELVGNAGLETCPQERGSDTMIISSCDGLSSVFSARTQVNIVENCGRLDQTIQAVGLVPLVHSCSYRLGDKVIFGTIGVRYDLAGKAQPPRGKGGIDVEYNITEIIFFFIIPLLSLAVSLMFCVCFALARKLNAPWYKSLVDCCCRNRNNGANNVEIPLQEVPFINPAPAPQVLQPVPPAPPRSRPRPPPPPPPQPQPQQVVLTIRNETTRRGYNVGDVLF